MNFYQDLGFLVFGNRLKRLANIFIQDINRIYKNHKIQFDASWFPVFYIKPETVVIGCAAGLLVGALAAIVPLRRVLSTRIVVGLRYVG